MEKETKGPQGAYSHILPYLYISVPITLKKTRTEKWNATRVFILKHETTEQQKEASHYHVTLPLEPTGISVTCAAL